MADALSETRLQSLEDLAIDLARAAGASILPLFRADHGLENKAAGTAFDPVTAADKGAEAAIRDVLAARFPEHGIIGEEYGEDRPGAEFVWVLDPIDGTRAFIAGLPLWCTLIGLRWQGEPVVGVIAQPYLDEVFVGSGGRARLIRPGHEERLTVRACPGLDQAIIATTDPDLFTDAERGAWTQVRAAARLARYGCDAYAYAMVAMGKMDLVLESGLKAWDIEAAVPVIEGAGGVVTNWRGERAARDGGQVAIAGDQACLDEALAVLRRAAR
jgi:histidinol phosphatase-like enzyme (inositol monophosphatase family)